MSFESILEQIVEGCGGGTGIALMGSDGIPIVSLPGSDAEANPLADEMAGVELSRVLGEVRKTSDALGGGGVWYAMISKGASLPPMAKSRYCILS